MLISQRSLSIIDNDHDNQPFSWFKPLLTQIASRFGLPIEDPNNFPCIFAQNAYTRKNIQFLLVPFKNGAYDLESFRLDLGCYLEECKTWDGNVNSAEPLLAIFEPIDPIKTTEAYQETFYNTLQYLIDNDPIGWREDTPLNPDQAFWSMCYMGVQLFVNVSHPNHINRRSRNLCEALVLVINPRDRFDVIAGNNEKGRLIREKIRSNIDIYDRISRSPLLGHYQDGELEWHQYMLPDDNSSPPLQCPLKFR